jgi:hypothetical protein
MRPAELRALHRVGLTESGQITVKQAALAEKKIELMYGWNDEETNQLVALGKETLELTIAVRIYTEHYLEAINLCPQCNQLARTPHARQCRYCGCDWH